MPAIPVKLVDVEGHILGEYQIENTFVVPRILKHGDDLYALLSAELAASPASDLRYLICRGDLTVV